jgi:hypothetical protein
MVRLRADSPYWTWEVVTYSTPESGVPIAILAYGRSGIEGSPPLEDPLIIAPVSELTNATVKDFILRYSFGISSTCNESGFLPREGEFDITFNRRIRFSLDHGNGQVPNIAATGTCAIPIGSIGIEREVEKLAMFQTFKMKHVRFSGPVHSPQYYALSVDAIPVSQVAARMLNETSCEVQSSPNVTGLVGKCRPKTSGYERPPKGSVILISAIVVAAVLFLV